MREIKKLMLDNTADENISKMIWIAIVFVVGAIILVLIASSFRGPIKDWWKKTVEEWFNPRTGDIDGNTTGGTNPDIGFDGPGDSV
ncbi:MAG: hypothetical protein II399_08065 [Lachnospiraceae bacterium]|nr:hypothetical protein [Lachnospiraceae bacterium]